MTAPTPDVILREANLTVLGGARTLRIDVERNMLGGQALVRLLAVDPWAPRRKPVNLLREAGVADVLVGHDDQTAADLLELLAECLRKAAS